MNRGATTNAVSIKGIGKLQLALTEGLINVFNRLGNPESDINSATFWLMVDNITQVWAKVFPYELQEFTETVKEQKENDRGSLKISQIGISNQYAIPAGLYKMLKTFFPYIQFTNKDFIHKFTERYPFTKTTNVNL